MKRYLVRLARLFMVLRSRFLNAWRLRGGYDPVRYWLGRGGGYRNEFDRHNEGTAAAFAQQEEVLLDTLRGLRFDSALELGCGFGRILKIVADNFCLRRLEGIDISPAQIAHAREYVNNHQVTLKVVDITRGLSYEDGEFDLVYTCEVLMHIPDPLPIMEEMLRVSRKHVLHVEYFDQLDSPLGPWCFNHDLATMYEDTFGTLVTIQSWPIIPEVSQQIVLVSKLQ